jgi:hypothetical protein
MNANRQTLSFLLLPAELRNHIYAYVLGGETFTIHCWRRYTPYGFETRILRKRRAFLALLAVCRQLHYETRLLPFRLNVFRFKSQDAFDPWLNKFALDQQHSIQNICLVTCIAGYLVEGAGWRSKPLREVLPVTRLPGLSKVEVEVKSNGRTRACARDGCIACEQNRAVVRSKEERFKRWLSTYVAGVVVNIESIAA